MDESISILKCVISISKLISIHPKSWWNINAHLEIASVWFVAFENFVFANKIFAPIQTQIQTQTKFAIAMIKH